MILFAIVIVSTEFNIGCRSRLFGFFKYWSRFVYHVIYISCERKSDEFMSMVTSSFKKRFKHYSCDFLCEAAPPVFAITCPSRNAHNHPQINSLGCSGCFLAFPQSRGLNSGSGIGATPLRPGVGTASHWWILFHFRGKGRKGNGPVNCETALFIRLGTRCGNAWMGDTRRWVQSSWNCFRFSRDLMREFREMAAARDPT